MRLVANHNRQPTIRSSGLLRSAPVTAQQSGDGKPDRFLVRKIHPFQGFRLAGLQIGVEFPD